MKFCKPTTWLRDENVDVLASAESDAADFADLAAIDQEDQLRGVGDHGVALASPIDAGTYRHRRTEGIELKRRIARRTAKIVPNGASVFLDAGSTCVAVAEALTGRSGLKVVTYNLRAV